MKRISPHNAQQRLSAGDACLVDVREAAELEMARLDPALHIPMAQLPQSLTQLPRERDLIMLCHHGIRSAMAADFLERNGFERVLNLEGGIDAWSREVDPQIPRY
ncbi:rhodanese-related sulfurtransferase [Natronospira proteinivora]|uniref:Rhodanese-related sulfurtransferase n=1 Tax=Natronospira proteinivora TaxID=1807133 RepID=A0ABT1GEH9_9GAMM|nr:rhodanese-like domain-containing protein [Natronospira proteinivora]MCP1728633.1 rhodanese-related sulfurtransferase [Natronospira proteinivora]